MPSLGASLVSVSCPTDLLGAKEKFSQLIPPAACPAQDKKSGLGGGRGSKGEKK